MTGGESVSLYGVEERVNLNYLEPPVHEVVLSLQLVESVHLALLEKLPQLLTSRFQHSDSRELTGFTMSVGPAGPQLTRTVPQFDGWTLSDAKPPQRILMGGRQQVSLHAVRPGAWPSGNYLGWQTIRTEALEIFQLLRAIYATVPIQRIGLRYLNRIAIPKNSDLEDWFKIGFATPPFLLDPFLVNLRQTWGRVDGYPGLSATVGLDSIEIPDPKLRDDHAGFLFDIEIFNLWPKDAPSYQDIPSWCNDAHEVENRIFESSITESLRTRFKVVNP